MAAVDIYNVKVLENPAPFEHPFAFEITYEVREPLAEDIEWKVVYVGSAEDEKYDQELESVLLPADTPGRFGFVLKVDAPLVSKLPADDILGVTVVLLSCSYKDAEFIRVGYYVNNEYTDENLIENPPATVQIDKVMRNIGADQPRVTKFAHKFDFSGENANEGDNDAENADADALVTASAGFAFSGASEMDEENMRLQREFFAGNIGVQSAATLDGEQNVFRSGVSAAPSPGMTSKEQLLAARI